MAIMKNLFLGACAIVSVARAAPVMVTVTDIVTRTHWTTIECTTTVWRNINESLAPSTSSTTSSSSTVPSPVVVPSSTSSVYVAPVVTTSQAVPTTTAVPTTPTTTAPVIAVVASPTLQTTTSAAAATPVATAGNFVQASSSGTCEGQGSACVGDVTHWDGGLGACGWNVNTASDMSIALPVGFMGSQSNGNPYCGRSVTLLNPATGTTVQAKVGDKCMGCVDRAIDCTDALFNAITDGKGDGRMSGIQWWLN